MASLNAVVVPGKVLKGGRHKIRISVAHNGETRYIVTNITIDSEKEFKNGAIVKRPDAAILNTKLRGLLQHYQDIVDELECINGFTCPELIYQIRNAGNYKHRTLSSVYDEFIANLPAKQSTLTNYANSWNNISKHLNEKMLVENITHSTVLGLDKSLRNRGLKSTTIRNYVALLKILVSYAKKCGYVQFRIDPFYGYKLPTAEIRQAWLSVDDIKNIRDLQSKKKNIRKCRDLFMLSYYPGVINITDLLDINFNEQADIIRYKRKKTENREKLNKFVEFVIPEEAKAIINRLKNKDGYIGVTSSQRKNICQDFFSSNMHKLAEATGIKYLIYYSAR